MAAAPPKVKDSSTVAFLKDFSIGGVAGGVSKTAMAPIERVKLLIQTQDANPKIRSGEVARYTGIGNCFTRVLADQGMKSFWRGNGANVIRYVPQQAFNLSFKDLFKQMFPKYNAKTEFAKFFAVNLSSAGMAAAGSLSICYPLDFARTRLASDVGGSKKTFDGIGDCIRKTVKQSGVSGLYNGFGASVGGVVVYRGLQMGMMDSIMGLNPYAKDTGLVGFFTCFLAAQVAGIAARPFNYPFDTVRRRLQMESEKPMDQRIYKGTFHCVKHIMQHEGLAGMYKGLVADIVRGAGSALVLVAYDRIKNLMAENDKA